MSVILTVMLTDYLSRSIGGHGMLQVHQAIKEKKALEEYLKHNEEDARKLGRHENLLNTKESKLVYKKDHMKTMARQSITWLVH